MMSANVGFRDAFKLQFLRRLGSWSSRLSSDDVDRILQWAMKVIPNRDVRDGAERLHTALHSRGMTAQLVQSFFDLAQPVRRKVIENILVNWGVLGGTTRYSVLEEEGWLPPNFAVISPTMRCNLRCEGCYAFQYRRSGELSREEFDSAIQQCKDLGMHFFTISGGEPFVREDLLDLMEKHNDAFFQVYTNGTLITDDVADRLLELGNAAPAISVEGYGEETDARRGEGTYDRVLAAMRRLNERDMLFGISATVTRYNHDLLSSDEFFDFYIDKGARFAWLFQYIPIGREPNVDLMSTADQRHELRHRVTDLRARKPIFIGDFWNDGVYVGGCMAGGRLYFHITSNGNVEPCVFCHFTVGNIKERPLKEILAGDFFRALRYEQPYSEEKNLYMPCTIIDHPEILRRLVKEHGARPSHEGAETIVEDPRIVDHLDRYAARLKELSQPEWYEDHYENPESEWFKLGERFERQWALERPYLEKWHREREKARRRRTEPDGEEATEHAHSST
ncbi:MAG: radical SAM protein [Candidatus Eisenbacteria bacterium]|nr:radical SAM protein [Candidatus Eisenbacteria bacterium]